MPATYGIRYTCTQNECDKIFFLPQDRQEMGFSYIPIPTGWFVLQRNHFKQVPGSDKDSISAVQYQAQEQGLYFCSSGCVIEHLKRVKWESIK